MSTAEILVIEGEKQVRKLLEINLSASGYKVHLAGTCKSGLEAAAVYTPDLIVLDLGLPDESGHVALKKLREWCGKPIIMLSDLNNVSDVVSALDNGANDFIIKPFHVGELLARIRVSLRNSNWNESRPVIRYQGLELDLSTRTVKKNNDILRLSVTQYELLVILGKNEGKVLTHQYLLREVWGPGYTDQLQYLRVFIAQLRKKIEDNANRPEFIVTESGIGYRFVAKQP